MTPDRLGPPSVEPLSDLDWARVERILWVKLDTGVSRPASPSRRSHHWLWMSSPLVAAAAITAIVVTRLDDGTGSEPPRVAVEPARYVSGDSASSLSFGNTYVSLEPQTAVLVSAHRTLVERGTATFALAPSSRDSSFEVVAGDAKASAIHAIETKFHVGRYAALVTVEVERGMLELTYHGTTTTLQAGETWSSHAAPTTVQLVTESQKTQPSTTRKVTKVTKAPKPLDSTRERYEHLAMLEVRDPAAALAGYLELAKSRSTWGEVSLFAAARLAGDHMDPRAGSLLNAYLTRFPRGANAPDARAILVRLQAQ